MTKRLFAILRYTAMVTMVAGLFTLVSCGNDDDGPTAFNGTVSAFIASDQFKQANTGSADNALDSLAKYIALYPDLVTVINGSSDVTLFAPSNTAFKNLLETPGFPSKISLISPDLIKGVLSYHIAMGKKMKADLTSGTEVSTLYNDAGTTTAAKIVVKADGTLLTGSSNNAIDIVVADQMASNGVVHIVESVMIPPSVGTALIPILGTMAGTVMLGKDFTYLAQLVGRADAGYTEDAATGKLKVISHLARPTSGTFAGATFFAPPNAVFEAAATAQGISASELIASFTTGAEGTARAVLLNHYVMGRYMVTASGDATAFENGQTIVPLSGEGKTIYVSKSDPTANNPYGVAVSNNPEVSASYKPIVNKDLTHTNGIVQVYGGILQ